MKICVFSLRPVNPLYRTWGRGKGGREGGEGGEERGGKGVWMLQSEVVMWPRKCLLQSLFFTFMEVKNNECSSFMKSIATEAHPYLIPR